ncbi:hypothetical protein XENTR_v10020477 [Xenopus tropicalis]|nr:hypothetical protein XENTR_v10020477 [Xenopus tropicalis]
MARCCRRLPNMPGLGAFISLFYTPTLQVAQQLCLLYSQCWQGDTAAVQEKITQLAQKKYDVKAKVQEVTPSDDDDDEESSDDKEEAMDCENTPSSSYAASASGTLGPSPAPKKEEEAEDDGWTVVCRKKK